MSPESITPVFVRQTTSMTNIQNGDWGYGFRACPYTRLAGYEDIPE